MVVLDTDILIDYMRGEPSAVAFIEQAVQSPDPLAVSAVTLMQLHHGVHRSRTPAREAEVVAAAMEAFTSYPFDGPAASVAGRLLAEGGRRGRTVGLPDLMIAATALVHGEPVATRNLRDFRRFGGLEVIAP